jgi:hypothetical protein
MTLRSHLRCLALLSAVLVAACQAPANRDDRAGTTSSVTASAATPEASTEDAYRHRRCGPGVQACTAEQVGQPCNPNDLFRLCLAQSNGSFCCLPFAQ